MAYLEGLDHVPFGKTIGFGQRKKLQNMVCPAPFMTH